MISTEKSNRYLNVLHCELLEVDRFEIDWEATMLRLPDQTMQETERVLFFGESRRDKNFTCPVARWEINGKSFCGAVPLRLEQKSFGGVLCSGEVWEYDIAAMEKELIKMISESRELAGT